MGDALKIFDIYSYSFNFLHKGQISYKTKVGGCVSLLTFFIFIISFVYFAQNFLYRLNPRIFIKSKIADDSFIQDIYDVKLLLGFSIDNLDARDIFDETYFKTNAYFLQTLKDNNNNTFQIRKDIKLQNCSNVKGDSPISKIYFLLFLNNFVK